MVPFPVPLPDPPRLRRPAHHRAPGVLQFGLDPADALVLDGLTPPLARMVGALDGSRPVARVLAEAAAAGACPHAARGVLERLHAAGLLATPAGPAPLADRRVVVLGAGRVAVAVVGLLAAAGVRRVLDVAGGVVGRGDVGTGLLPADVGRAARPAAAEAVARAGGRPTPSGSPAQRWLTAHADLVVLADGPRPDPVTAAALTAAGRPHLVVAVVDGTGTVGPLVVPGRTPCLRCADLVRADADPAWPRLAAGLAGRGAPVPVVTAAAVAALAAAQVLAELGGGPADARGAVLEVATDGTRDRRELRRHPGCGCHALRGRAPARRTAAAA
ncbi:hypothetical protein GCM10023200_34330 [Actinomycetospora chlora]|uniref:Bacteriocin biosynthesis cyclodehydratase domain-containing protein n=1 Tax=Actinomycetospora chlora TaxID=663608 RepID=A0ABP9BHM1_9PSEU